MAGEVAGEVAVGLHKFQDFCCHFSGAAGCASANL